MPEDVLVFEHGTAGFSLMGGRGRGAGWAGQVHVAARERSLLSRAWRVGHIVRQEADRPRHVVGPYYAAHAAAVPLGHGHVVVFGSREPISALDSDLMRAAVAEIDAQCGVPAEKLLADELEVVAAVRTLMAFRPTNVRETARHVAAVTARALACEVAAISVYNGTDTIVEGVGFGVDGPVPGPRAGMMLSNASHSAGPDIAQSSSDGPALFGIDFASRMTLPIGGGTATAALAVGHSAERPRGFTALCQRIGRAIAESADALLIQALAHEELDARVDSLSRSSTTDALTGVANRRRWDEAVAALAGAGRGYPAAIISVDIDGLKQVNDRYGHPVGDSVLVAAAQLLGRCVRADDLVARVGGDEFAVLIRGGDMPTATRVMRRIRHAERSATLAEYPVCIRMSAGVAPVTSDGPEAAMAVADGRMYVNKRRRKATRAAAA
jgi:diguanylate cyclase (GGDEF)-like protein